MIKFEDHSKISNLSSSFTLEQKTEAENYLIFQINSFFECESLTFFSMNSFKYSLDLYSSFENETSFISFLTKTVYSS